MNRLATLATFIFWLHRFDQVTQVAIFSPVLFDGTDLVEVIFRVQTVPLLIAVDLPPEQGLPAFESGDCDTRFFRCVTDFDIIIHDCI